MNNVTYINEDLRRISAELPQSYSTRWSASRKAAVVNAVELGVISLGKAMQKYRLSLSEFESWQENFASKGLQGLKVTKAVAQR
jgi:hypothetical protein